MFTYIKYRFTLCKHPACFRSHFSFPDSWKAFSAFQPSYLALQKSQTVLLFSSHEKKQEGGHNVTPVRRTEIFWRRGDHFVHMRGQQVHFNRLGTQWLPHLTFVPLPALFLWVSAMGFALFNLPNDYISNLIQEINVWTFSPKYIAFLRQQFVRRCWEEALKQTLVW